MDEESSEATPLPSRYLLPEGCKDLIDVLRRQHRRTRSSRKNESERSEAKAKENPPSIPKSAAKEPITKSIAIPDPVIVHDLATILQLKAFQVLGVLLQMNILVNINQSVDFQTASSVCAHFGVTATRAAS